MTFTNSLIVQSQIRNLVKELGLNTGGDLADKLQLKITQIIKEGAERALANNRKTLMAKDI